jgi:potassium-transporting ATPase ATP-binding subunit
MAGKNAFDKELVKFAFLESFNKLNPWTLRKNLVMLLVELGAAATTVVTIFGLFSKISEPLLFTGLISVWLWLTVLFANFAEALAERRGKARAEFLTRTRTDVIANKLSKPIFEIATEQVKSGTLRKGDFVIVEAGELIPGDGDVIKGAALVDESVITGESAPVLRESGGDRCAVTGGTKVISDKIIVKISADPGEAFMDKIIAMIEGAKRRKTPNEIALDTLIISLTVLFILVVINLYPISTYSVHAAGAGKPISLTILIALFVCLAPTTIAALLSAIAISGMDRLFRKSVVALSGKAIESAGDVDIILLDKTGTITIGNREAVKIIPVEKYSEKEVAEAALNSSLADETAEGRSIAVLVKHKYGISIKELPKEEKTIPFTAQTRVSGAEINGHLYLKGAADSIIKRAKEKGLVVPKDVELHVQTIAKTGGTPLLVSKDNKILGIIHLKDIVKEGIKERIVKLRLAGIKSIMITGDNPLTAAAITAEAGIDDFLAEAKPEDKLRLIREYQEKGLIVAMIGDGTNDAPALAQADVAVAMQTGTQAAREAANIIDLDSNPTKLIDIVETGKQMLMTRGSLTTFSIANDISKYFAIVPAAMASFYPQLGALNIMHLHDPFSAILSAVIFNAIVIPLLIPLALRGVPYKPMPAHRLLVYNMLIYGLGGIIVPFIGIKLIDLGIMHLI